MQGRESGDSSRRPRPRRSGAGRAEQRAGHRRHSRAASRPSGFPPLWIAPETADHARAQGYTVVDAVSVLGTHLAELIRRHASELLSRQETKAILDRVAEDNPKVVEDLVPKLLPLATVQKVFQNLLRERVSIRDAVTILESLGEAGAMTKNPILLTEYARQAIRRLLVKPYLNAAGELPAFFVDSQIEQAIEGAIQYNENSSHLNLPPQKLREILDRVTRSVGVTRFAGGRGHQFLGALLPAADGGGPAAQSCRCFRITKFRPGVRVVSLGLIQ